MSLILSGTDGLSDVDGSAATPAIRGTDANTGIFFPAADTIAFSEGGAEAMRIDSSGNVGIGTSVQTSGVRLISYNATSGAPATTGTTQASGALRIRSGSNAICDFGVGAGSGTTTWIQAADQTGLNTNYDIAIQPNGGSVGIGTASPASKLDINTGGSTGTTDMITLSGLDNASTKQTYGVIRMGIENSTAGSEQGNLHLQTVESGTVRDRIFMKGGGEITFSNGGTERMRISSAGYVTYGNNPAFSASLNGSQQNVTSGSTVTLTFGTANYNRSSSFNTSTYTFTAPVAGMYQFNARARVDGISGGGGNYAILALLTTGQTYNSICSASGSYNNLSISVSTYMASGHTAYVTLTSSGQTINAVNNQPVYSDFSGFLIG
jgi:hypothetical protein